MEVSWCWCCNAGVRVAAPALLIAPGCDGTPLTAASLALWHCPQRAAWSGRDPLWPGEPEAGGEGTTAAVRDSGRFDRQASQVCGPSCPPSHWSDGGREAPTSFVPPHVVNFLSSSFFLSSHQQHPAPVVSVVCHRASKSRSFALRTANSFW